MYYKQFINFVPGCQGNLPIVVFQFLVCGTKFLILPLRGHDAYKTYPIFTPFLTRPRAPKEDEVEGRHLSWCFLPLHTIQDHLSSVLFVQEQPKKTARWLYFPIFEELYYGLIKLLLLLGASLIGMTFDGRAIFKVLSYVLLALSPLLFPHKDIPDLPKCLCRYSLLICEM